MSRIAVPARLGDDGTVEHPERWHRDHWHRGPFWLRHRDGNGGPLRRDPTDRLGGGVAAGVAAWKGFNVTTVRIVFVLIAMVSTGWFVPVYVAGWLLIPAADVGRQHRHPGQVRLQGHPARNRPVVAGHPAAAGGRRAQRRLARRLGVAAGVQRGRAGADLAERPAGRAGHAAAPGGAVRDGRGLRQVDGVSPGTRGRAAPRRRGLAVLGSQEPGPAAAARRGGAGDRGHRAGSRPVVAADRS